MLIEPPSKYPERYKTAKKKIKDTWPLIHRLNVDIFRNVWEKCTDEPFIDLTKIKLDNWKYQSGMAVFFYEGLMLNDKLAEIERCKNIHSGNPASDVWKGLGLTREVRANGTVAFYCFMHNKSAENKPRRCGLEIELTDKQISVLVRKPEATGENN